MRPINKDDLDLHTLRIQDKIDKITSKVVEKIEHSQRLQAVSKMQIFDNQDLIFLTRRSARTLQICRSKGLLIPMSTTGKNFYTLTEVERFRYKVLPYLPEELSLLEKLDVDAFIHEYQDI